MRFLLAGAILLLPQIAIADIYNCDGKWTNKACSAEQTRATFSETVRIPPVPLKGFVAAHVSGSPAAPINVSPGAIPVGPAPLSEANAPTVPAQDPNARAALEQPPATAVTEMPVKITNEKPCSDSEYFITVRPEPTVTFTTERTRGRSLLVHASVRGYGPVRVELVGFGDGIQQRRISSKFFRLPQSGGEKHFSQDITLPDDWYWMPIASNERGFDGYCSARSAEQLKTEWQADEALRRSKAATATAEAALYLHR